VLVELGVVEQRYRAVLEVLDEGASVTDVARRYGIARQTVHEWLRRYANHGGLGGLVDKSSRPETCPHQMPPQVEARVLWIRRAHPAWGPSRIVWQLEREGRGPLPGRSSVYRALVRHGLVEAKKRRRRREDYRRWERSRAMELWQTSDSSMVSSGRGDWLPECFGVVVGLAGGEAVVKLAEVAVEQVSQCRGVAVAEGPAAVIVGTRGW
jgi:transposase